MTTIRLIVPDAKRRTLLRGVFEEPSDLNVIYSSPDLDEVFGDNIWGLGAEVTVVDLSLPRASQGLFWAVLHQLYASSRLVAIIEPATPKATIELALVAGAAWVVQWADPADRLCAIARAAGQGELPAIAWAANEAVAASFNHWRGTRRQPAGDELVLDPVRRRAVVGERLFQLSVTEYRILERLACKDGVTVSTDELLQAGWRYAPSAPATHAQLRVAIHRLRAKIETDPHQPRYLLTASDLGYQLCRYGVGPIA